MVIYKKKYKKTSNFITVVTNEQIVTISNKNVQNIKYF